MTSIECAPDLSDHPRNDTRRHTHRYGGSLSEDARLLCEPERATHTSAGREIGVELAGLDLVLAEADGDEALIVHLLPRQQDILAVGRHRPAPTLDPVRAVGVVAPAPRESTVGAQAQVHADGLVARVALITRAPVLAAELLVQLARRAGEQILLMVGDQIVVALLEVVVLAVPDGRRSPGRQEDERDEVDCQVRGDAGELQVLGPQRLGHLRSRDRVSGAVVVLDLEGAAAVKTGRQRLRLGTATIEASLQRGLALQHDCGAHAYVNLAAGLGQRCRADHAAILTGLSLAGVDAIVA